MTDERDRAIRALIADLVAMRRALRARAGARNLPAMPIGNLRRQALRPGKLVQLVLNQLTGDPVLHLEHLGDTNVGFVNDALAGQKSVRAVTSKGASTPTDIARIRDANRETVSRHCVRKIEGFYHDGPDGGPDPAKPVESTPEGIREVVFSLPDEVFDIVLAFVSNPENFRDRVPAGSPAEVAKK